MKRRKISEREFIALLKRYDDGTCSPEEERLIAQWYNALNSPSSIEKVSAREAEIKGRSWAAITRRIEHQSSTETGWQIYPLIGIAASVVFIIVSIFYVYRFNRPVDTGALASASGETTSIVSTTVERMVALPDGSTVVLKPLSSVEFSTGFEMNRTLVLKGEAFFDVKRDEQHPFTIHADKVVTTVLGTSFSIRAYNGEGKVTVSVKTGKVTVSLQDNAMFGLKKGLVKQAVLTPNAEVTVNLINKSSEVSLVERPTILPAEEEFVRSRHFEEAAFPEIIEALKKAYGVDIQYNEKSLSSCRLSTTLLLNEDLFQRLHVVCLATNSTYEVEENVIRIKGNGCKN